MNVVRIRRSLTSVRRIALICMTTALAVPTTPAQEVSSELLEASRSAPVLFGNKRTVAGSVKPPLSLPMRQALNTWASFALEHELQIAIPREANVLLLVRMENEKELKQLIKDLDTGWKLLADLCPKSPQSSKTIIAVILDEPGYEQVWPVLLSELVERRLLSRFAADSLTSDRGALTLRSAGLFIQPTWDIAGNADAGDDEFRLGNEVLHKFAQGALATWYGEVPDTLRWGLGYVLEQRVFHSIYQFNRSGFVATTDHFDWPKKVQVALKDRAASGRFSLGTSALDRRSAGTLSTPQMIVWVALDYLVANDPESLQALLSDLAALHAEASGSRPSPDYQGDKQLSLAALDRHLGGITAKVLIGHAKRVK